MEVGVTKKTMMKRWKTVDGSGGATIQMELRQPSCCTRPAWLLTTLADLDQKISILVHSSSNDNDEGRADTFAQRAEAYYQQRPQLLSLLLDLYNAYLSLAERYCQSLHKHHNQAHPSIYHHRAFSTSDNVSVVSSFHDNHSEEACQSDAESSLSYQLPSVTSVTASSQYNNLSDDIIAELVIKNVEYDFMVDELVITKRLANDSSRKVELQRSLLEVLESERLILLNENAGLRYKVGALIDENKGLASESMFMKRKAGELARCVLKMREDHRVCMLSRKIEELQGKIYGLERRNREYYQQLVKQEKTQCSSCKETGNTSMGEVLKTKDVEAVSTEACFQEDKERNIYKKGVRISKFWEKVKNSDLLFLCKPHPSRSIGR
ncbi:kinase-interacting family protein-like [Chenopodium quinoa]|nr:kinase-interacting family protein-like [Chenopodium quinoa]